MQRKNLQLMTQIHQPRYGCPIVHPGHSGTDTVKKLALIAWESCDASQMGSNSCIPIALSIIIKWQPVHSILLPVIYMVYDHTIKFMQCESYHLSI